MHKQPLTPEQEQFVRELEGAKAIAEAADKRLSDVRKKCKHLFTSLTDEMRGELRTLSQKSWKYDSADCLLCQRSFGYRCPDSPDTVCHYYTESVPFTAQNGVRLVTGEFVDYPEGHDVENETDDQCIFCGQPEERK